MTDPLRDSDPTPRTFDGWRFFYVQGPRLIAPFRSGPDLDEIDLDANCQTFDHPAPALDCSCGIWCCASPASLLSVALNARRYNQLPAIVAAAVAAEERGEDFRLFTIEGVVGV